MADESGIMFELYRAASRNADVWRATWTMRDHETGRPAAYVAEQIIPDEVREHATFGVDVDEDARAALLRNVERYCADLGAPVVRRLTVE